MKKYLLCLLDSVMIMAVVSIVAVPCIMSKYPIDNMFGIAIFSYFTALSVVRSINKIKNSK